MESNDDQNLEAINASVGRLVWVRRRNGSWWPGQTLVHDQVSDNSLVSPKVGTPIKLLGRDDVSVDWYILENSKTVKAFRCGEYDTCIEKAKAAAAASSANKKAAKCTRREDAINNALEIENSHLAKEDHPGDNLCSSSGEEDSKRCLSGKEDEDLGSSDAGEAEDELDSVPEQLQSSMSSQEMNNVGVSKVQPRRRRTPNDSEDDGTEGVKRMRGLEDIGKEQVGAIIEHRQEMGLICAAGHSDSVSNGNIIANGDKVCSPTSLKRKRAQVIIAHECSKRKNRRRQLTKVLESTAMVSVPVTCDQLVTLDSQGIYDTKLSGMETVESMKSVSVVINNNSDSTGVSCEDAYENVVGASHNNKAKDSEISSISVSAEDDSSDRLFDVPLIGEEKHSEACRISSPRRALVTDLTRRRGLSSQDVFVKNEGSNGYASTSSPVSEPVNSDLNGVEKSTSKWQLKGKRNSRQMSKKQEARRTVYGEQANNNSSVPHSGLYEVKIEVKENYKKPRNVPLVSRMSELNGKAIVGHPITVEILEEGYCNGVVMSQVVVKTKSLSKKNGKKRKSRGASWNTKKKSSSQSIKTRRLSTLTSQRLTEKIKKQATGKAKETVVACIPLKVVFSRINQVLKGSARQTQHRALPSAVKT
ncbi:PREDICTED: uncharacterized protein At1g51745-like isoform X2 [Camelina sativa]|uniref:Uncharacterized protein At1g51745-like isoform X2 n=1 Tax=Camelina sativa TaxID=90675 RepID=A0ABM0YH22_CAMSA|nr:PREDICTED: uncharacterized protein At1g51745-like isoform X2 [Camelina sativa]